VSTAALSAIVLAAGEGTRMRSSRPKPLHRLSGRAMVLYVLDSLRDCGIDRAVVVVGYGADQVTKHLIEDDLDLPLEFVEQVVQRGTGDAVMVGLTGLPDDDGLDDTDDGGDVLVLPGDTPLLRATTVTRLVEEHQQSGAACTVLTTEVDDATGYGRVIRGRDGTVARIVEHRDATDDERAVREINTSIYCFRRSVLAPALRRLQPDNAQGELYLTDVIAVLRDAGYPIEAVIAPDPGEVQGVNDRAQLATAESELRRRTAQHWLRQGVTLLDPERTAIDATVELARDVTLFPGTLLQGRTKVARGAEIGPDTRLVDCTVGVEAVVTNTVAAEAEIGDGAVVGPFAVLDPGTVVGPWDRTGPFFHGTITESD
jgi:bifunctional UDP-N-acetylglucosamine pyrophosphorylase/glucosamine-1-phosphate N-acetyltransferase